MIGIVGQTIDRALEPLYGTFHRYGLAIGKEKTDRTMALIFTVALVHIYLIEELFWTVSKEKQKLTPGICLLSRFQVEPNEILTDSWSSSLVSISSFLISSAFLKNLKVVQGNKIFFKLIGISMIASFSGAIAWQTVEKAIETRSYENLNIFSCLGALLSVVSCNWLGKRASIPEPSNLLFGSFILAIVTTHVAKKLASIFFTELTSCLTSLDMESVKTETLSSPFVNEICVFQGSLIPIIPCLFGSVFQKIFFPKPVEQAENITQKEAVKRTFTQIMLSGGIATAMWLDDTLRPFLEKNGFEKNAPTLLPSLLPLFFAAVLIRAAAARPDIFSGPGSHKETIVKALFLATAFHILPRFEKLEDPLLQQLSNFINWSAVSLGVIYTTSLCSKIGRVTQDLLQRRF